MNNLSAVIANSQEVYRQAIENCDEQIQNWKKNEQEYLELKERLELLPRTLTQDVMVPFGKYALMPGQLTHTNEVMVLLGDNWFAKRSAYQANEIVDRRLKYVREMIKKFEDERKRYFDRLEATKRYLDHNDEGDYIEIHEPVPSEMDRPKKIRIAHKPKKLVNKEIGDVQAATSSTSNGTLETRTAKKVSDEEFVMLMDRLNELDMQERFEKPNKDISARNKNDIIDGKVSPAQNQVPSTSGRKIKWQDDATSASSEISVIEEPAPLTNEVPEATLDTRPVKSILKKRDEIIPVGEIPPSPYELQERTISSVTDEVFNGTIKERAPTVPTSSNELSMDQPSRRVSKFARERAGLKKD